MVHGVAEIVALLSRLFELRSGDLVFTGTPAGVGPLLPGDRFDAGFGEQLRLSGRIVDLIS
jgi:fumarylpyruvate hydrolase